jgi:hypothetical protein
MTQPIIFNPARSVLFHPSCPKCGAKMWLVGIEPAEPGYDLRTFECAPCEVATAERVKYAD